eukprot:m.27457 g.27457  ORF g.27457 m.27457 type:complete len:479 (-) comp4775_c0_seq1:258-1694(-)
MSDQEKTRKQRMREMLKDKQARLAQERVEEEQRRMAKAGGEVAAQAHSAAPDFDMSKLSEAEQREVIQKRIQELEVSANADQAKALKAKLDAAEGDLVEPTFIEYTVDFDEERWGMRARLSGGPVIITLVQPDGEGARKGVQLGDVIWEINGIVVEMEREPALDLIRKGGKAKVVFKRLEGQRKVFAGQSGDEKKVIKGEMSHSEQLHLQAMIGAAKGKDTVAYAGKKGVTEVITADDINSNATVVISGCSDSKFTLDALCTKVFVQGCNNLELFVNGKILTGTIEVFKCENLTLHFAVKVGTLQVDMSTNVTANFAEIKHFHDQQDATSKNHCMVVWAGVENLGLNVLESGHSHFTGFAQMREAYNDLVMERSQFRVCYNKDGTSYKFKEEQIVRLENGFFTTTQEKNEFDAREEANVQAMAKSLGITMGRKTAGKKYKPNEQCPAGSGLKYKKCCNRMDGTCDGKGKCDPNPEQQW